MGLHEWVHPLQGTDSRNDFSTGHTYPAIGVPRGLTYWTPQNSDATGFLFDRIIPRFAGFRATHLPSPWMGDYGHFDVMPVHGAVGLTPVARASGYDLRESTVLPNVFRTHLHRYGIDAALAATYSGAVMEFVYPADARETAAIVVQTGQASTTMGTVEMRGGHLRGKAMSHSGGTADNFACYFVVQVEGAEVKGHSFLHAGGRVEGETSLLAPRAGVVLRIVPRGVVTVRVATSFISFEQAELNLQRELGDKSLKQVAAEAGEKWDAWLGRVEAEGGTEWDRQTLYTCLYRVGLWPMPMHEADANGQLQHYSPHTGRIHAGRFYTNNGFWDTYRTCYSLLRLIDPVGFGEIVDGLLAHAREGGWMPKWCSPGYRDCMIGSHSDAVISEAILGGIGGFDVHEAYEAVRKNAFEPVEGHGRYGRKALREYASLGYMPHEAGESALSWTLDNAQCDWCLGQVAAKLGRRDDAQVLLARAQNYRKMWDPGTQFFRPRNRDGQWVEPFSVYEWGHAYVEGGPWQFLFHVPHDPQGLAELMGGRGALVRRLEEMLATRPRFELGHYNREIHEMTEMALAVDLEGRSFGQYAHSNQPVHAFLMLPAALGLPEWTGRQVQRVMRSLYSPTHLPGDEDNGEMAAWYVLGALGHGAACPGSGKTVEIPVKVFDRCIARPGV